MVTVCVDSLSHQQSLLTLFLDALLRRAVISTHAVVDFVYPSGAANVNVSPLSASHLGDNIWVWSVTEAAVERSLDIVVAGVGMLKSFKSSKQTESR